MSLWLGFVFCFSVVCNWWLLRIAVERALQDKKAAIGKHTPLIFQLPLPSFNTESLDSLFQLSNSDNDSTTHTRYSLILIRCLELYTFGGYLLDYGLCFFISYSWTVRATGEAQSARLIGSALAKNSSFLELRRIEAAREIASVISQSSNKVFLNSDALLVNLAARSPVVAGHEDNVAAAIIDAAAKAGHEDNVAAAIVQAGKANASPAGATKPVEAAQKK